jgi:cardiolipin synthase (CMP-forming)
MRSLDTLSPERDATLRRGTAGTPEERDAQMPDGSELGRVRAATLLTVPNVITFGRLCIVPIAVWFVLEQGLIEAFFLFVAAGVSDAVDGWLARRNGGGNLVGAVLDPVADKALLVSMYVTLAGINELPDWLAILVVFRDLVIVGGVIVLSVLDMPVVIRPLYVSKLNTVLQIILVAVTLLLAGYGWHAELAKQVLIWCVAFTTLASGAAYVWNAARGQ